ncbi:response regulator [Isoptericola sp. NPDC056573]|uniref:PIG-L deacetylase family protein n=1 Tax=unclassified Isoptericola TaxID=2623355 RepID=UPI0036C32A71
MTGAGGADGRQDRPRVLVVEDDPDAAAYVRTVLTRLGGMDVAVAGDGDTALERLDEHPELLVTDVELPGLSGLELIHEARERVPGIPVIVMTAHASVEYAVEALRESADEFLVKPLDSARLVERAHALVDAARRRARPTDRVLAVGAHPDDVEIGVGATLASHRSAGDEVTVLVLSGGAVGGVAADRRLEAAAATAEIGAGLVVRDLEDTRIDLATAITAIEEVIAEVRPTIVYTHSANDRHQDHRTVHRAVDVAARRVSTVACYQSPSATIEFRPTRFVPVDGFVETKLRMLAAFVSQSHRDYMQPDLVRATARYWSRYGGGEYVEPLEMLRASQLLGRRQSAGANEDEDEEHGAAVPASRSEGRGGA